LTEDVESVWGLFMDSGKVEVEAVEFSEAEKSALDDIQGVFDDLEDGLIMSLNAVRELRKRFKRSENEELDARAEDPPTALDVLGPVAAKIAENREANTVKGQ
jgi:hypothetical protein